MPPLLRVLLSALSQIRCFPEGSCQLILVSFVHLASSADNGDLERIFDPFVGFAEVDMRRRFMAEKTRREEVIWPGRNEGSSCILTPTDRSCTIIDLKEVSRDYNGITSYHSIVCLTRLIFPV